MKSRLVSLGIVVGVVGVGIGFVACSSGGTTNGGPGSNSCAASAPQVTLQWNPAYTGTDGTTTDTTKTPATAVKVQIPAWVALDSSGGTVPATSQTLYKWTSSSTSVKISATDSLIDPAIGGVMITVDQTLAASEVVTLTAQESTGGAAAACGSASLTVTKYDAGLFDQGSTRYWTGATTDAGPVISDPTVLIPYLFPTGAPAGLDAGALAARFAAKIGNAGQACANCHQASPNPSFASGVSHTPEQVGGYTDSELVQAFEHGVIYDGGYFEPIPQALTGGGGAGYDAGLLTQGEWGLFHQWTFDSTDQAQGVVIYLRSLAPAQDDGALTSGRGGRGDAGYTPRDGGGGYPGADGGGIGPGGQDSGSVGTDAGSGGTDAGSGGTDAGSGGTDAATGG